MSNNTMVEISNVERAGLSDVAREYVSSLETELTDARAELVAAKDQWLSWQSTAAVYEMERNQAMAELIACYHPTVSESTKEPVKDGVCVWAYRKGTAYYYDLGCGSYYATPVGIAESGIKQCPYCNKQIKLKGES